MLAGFFGWLIGKVSFASAHGAAKALLDAVEDMWLQHDYAEAIKENARYEAEARDRAGADATRERMRNAPVDTDLSAIADRLRNRDPNAR